MVIVLKSGMIEPEAGCALTVERDIQMSRRHSSRSDWINNMWSITPWTRVQVPGDAVRTMCQLVRNLDALLREPGVHGTVPPMVRCYMLRFCNLLSVHGARRTLEWKK